LIVLQVSALLFVCWLFLTNLSAWCACFFGIYSLLHLVIVSIAYAMADRWLWKFATRTRCFLTAHGNRFVLRYAPELHAVVSPGDVLTVAESALTELERRFGRLSLLWHGRTIGPLLFRKRVYVYLFPAYESVQAVFGKRFGGIALTGLNAVVIPFEGLRLDEWLKHELGHLFSDRWNEFAPPLFQEGLSTWLQETDRGYRIDAMAVTLIRREEYHLRPMLGRRFFFHEENHWAYYILAGSFTGFLIRRFGWDAYKRFYCQVVDRRRCDAQLPKHFGMTLEQAEEQWREELLARYRVPFGEWPL
jgi:hypothetical protein